jgi:hypothetical protein
VGPVGQVVVPDRVHYSPFGAKLTVKVPADHESLLKRKRARTVAIHEQRIDIFDLMGSKSA